MSVSSRHVVLGSLGVALLVFCMYWPTRTFEFLNFDDPDYVLNNAYVQKGLTWEGFAWAFSSTHGAHWHPLSWLSLMLDVELFGVNSAASHLVNAAFHAINMALFFWFAAALTGLLWPSLWAALLLGLHPLRIESVAWVTERKDVLSVFFLLLSLCVYVRWVRSVEAKRAIRLGLFTTSVIFFVFSLLAKPTAVVLPVLLLCLDYWPLGRMRTATFFKLTFEKIPFFAVAGAVAVAAVWAQGSGGGLKSLSAYPLAERAASVLVAYQAYFGKLFFPTGLGIFYPFTQYQPGVGAGALLGLLIMSWWFWEKGKTQPWLRMGWMWFLVSLLPMIGIVQIGGQAFADRWTYVPHMGLLLALALSARTVLETWPRLRVCAASLSVCIAAFLTYSHLPNWKDSQSIFRHTASVSPQNFMAHMNLGVALDAAGNLPAAAEEFDKAVLIKPFFPDALVNLGGARARLGDLPNAEFFFRRAVNHAPAYVPAKYNLGLLLRQTGRPSQGLLQWVKAYTINPAFPQLMPSIRAFLAQFRAANCGALTSSPQEIEALREVEALLEQVFDLELKTKLYLLTSCAG